MASSRITNQHVVAGAVAITVTLPSDATLAIPEDFTHRWAYAYLLSAVLFLIGLITLLFMLRVI